MRRFSRLVSAQNQYKRDLQTKCQQTLGSTGDQQGAKKRLCQLENSEKPDFTQTKPVIAPFLALQLRLARRFSRDFTCSLVY
jgi:hypothetical protein